MQKNKVRLFTLLMAVLCCSGCATGSYYYKYQGAAGGFSEVKIQDDLFKVAYSENQFVSPETAEDFALLRSADVAIQNGYKYFVILEQKSDVQKTSVDMPSYSTTMASGSIYPATYSGSMIGNTINYGGGTYVYSRPSTSNMIKCFKEKPENLPTIIYDAVQVRDSIKTKHSIR
ncbi:MAG: hypothetical protein HYT89_02055 [Candidatus Omnitrophica bacterium]|nr:hypothetical protein [Candidatus Omnitrophota bacterium]